MVTAVSPYHHTTVTTALHAISLATAIAHHLTMCTAFSLPLNQRTFPTMKASAFLADSTKTTKPNPSGKARHAQTWDTNSAEHAPSNSQQLHPYKCTELPPSYSFWNNSLEQTLCVVCLNRSHQNMAECCEETLNDGEPAFSKQSKMGCLVDRKGKSLCLKFQLPKGCYSNSHRTRHRCSGCGSDHHGTSSCPR